MAKYKPNYDMTKEAGLVNEVTIEARKVLLTPADKLGYEHLGVLDKLYRTTFKTNFGDPHLGVDNDICKTCAGNWCLYCCPSQRFTKDAEGLIHVDYEGCFECGTCFVACLPKGLVLWKQPLGGFGVSYKYG